MPERLLHATDSANSKMPVTRQSETIGKLLAENTELRQQIANIVLQTASLRETLENQRTHH